MINDRYVPAQRSHYCSAFAGKGVCVQYNYIPFHSTEARVTTYHTYALTHAHINMLTGTEDHANMR